MTYCKTRKRLASISFPFLFHFSKTCFLNLLHFFYFFPWRFRYRYKNGCFIFEKLVGLIWHAWNFCYFQKKYLSRQSGNSVFLEYIAAIFRKMINLFIRIYSLICFLNVYLIVFWTTLSLCNGFNCAQIMAKLAFFGIFWIF